MIKFEDLFNLKDSNIGTSSMQHWYVVQVLSGQEKKVKKSIEDNRESNNMIDSITEVLLPSEKVSEIKQGEHRVRERHLWPGYLLVKMDTSDEAWHYIKNTNGVIDFIGSGKPQRLSDAEVDGILNDLRSKRDEIVHKYNIELNDTVKIIDGVFVNFTGTVTEIFHDKGRLSVLVSIFGRDTRVDDLEFWQVEKIIVD